MEHHATIERCAIDLAANFDTVTNWTYSFENHRHGLNQTEITALCEKISTKLTAATLVPATEFDLSTVKNSMNFIVSHKAYFTIDEFTKVLGPMAKSELMASLFEPVITAHNLNSFRPSFDF